MVLSSGIQIRRPHTQKPLRKPLTPTSLTSTVTNKAIICDDLIKAFKSRILLLDEEEFGTPGEVLKKEILSSLNEGALTTSGCLQLFLDTAWKDRNRSPIIAKMFHNITQDYDDESITGLTTLLEKTCNDLLNILTLLGKPNENDLRIVTLLSNLYHLKDLPQEHRQGVESYLIDIAKAFWPYFVPQKHEVWDNELVSDAICDVLHTVGKVLEKNCPVNMERTFNKITSMLYSKNTISKYTRLRLLEVKESRAAGWLLPDSAKDYYRDAFLKHSRQSCGSPQGSIPHSSPNTSDEEVFDYSSTESSPSPTPTKTKFLVDRRYDISICKKLTTASKTLVCHIKEKPQIDQNNNVKTPVVSMSTISKKELDPSYELGSEDKSCQMNFNHELLDDTGSDISTPKEAEVQSKRNGFITITGGFGSPNVSDMSINADKATCSLPPSEKIDQRKSLISSDSSPSFMHNGVSTDSPNHGQVSPNSNKLQYCKPSNPEKKDTAEKMELPNGTIKSIDSWPSFNKPTTSSSSFSEETSPHAAGIFSRDSSIFSRGLSCPETNIPPSFSESPFSRSNGFSADNGCSRHRLSSTGETTYQTRPFDRNGRLQRSQSESSNVELSYSSRHWQSSGDSTSFGNSDGGRFGSWRPSFQRQTSSERWRSNLEFPVKDVLEEEDLNPSSRLYLLSFAMTPAALERPLDLTLTPELEAEKEWLKCVVLDEPETVLNRFG